ncbi:MAG: O-antigen ligase family protein [Phycisphaeraceae bacterium]|nr:O-antigen ligase family protein [Phycisphaeraceae bacterium]
MLLLGGLGGLLFVLMRPRWAFVLVTMMFPLKQTLQAYIPSIRGVSGYGVNIAVAGVAGFAVLARVIKGERVVAPFVNVVSISVLAMYLLVLTSFSYTPAIEGATVLLKESWPYYILMMLVLPLLLRGVGDFRSSLTAILCVGLALSVFIFLSPATGFLGTRMVLSVIGRSDKSGNPLAIAELGGMLAVVAALMWYGGASKILNLVRIAAFLVGLGLGIASGTRGQVFSAAIVSLLFFPMARQVKNLKQFVLLALSVGIVGGGIYLAFDLFLWSQNQSRFNATQMTIGVQDRLERVLVLLDAWASQPTAWLFGLGANAFSSLIRTTGGAADYVHNTAAEALCEYGLVGATLYTIGLYFSYRAGVRIWARVKEDPGLRAAATILIAISTYSLLLSFKQGCILGLPAPFYWWMVVAYIDKSERINEASMMPHAPLIEHYEEYTEQDQPAEPATTAA